MGRYDSSLTRVQPVFNELLKRNDSAWLPELWRMAASTRPGAADPPPSVVTLVHGKMFERTLPPSTAFLRWMVQNTDKLSPLPAPDYGATPGGTASAKRAQLFGADASLREAARAEALTEIEKKGGKGSAQQWWAFEGFTHVDACFETEECLLLVEGKRTEAVSPSTRWFKSRNQLWRNVEVAGELAGGRPFGVILAVETRQSGQDALIEAEKSRAGSYPHLSPERQAELDRHFLGFVVWKEIVKRFELPPKVLWESSD